MVYANRDSISKLLSLSAKFEKPVDFKKASTHPLYPFPLSMAFPDGSKRETQKSKLLQEILPDIPERTGEINIAKEQCVYVVDMIAQLKMCLSMIPDTFEQLILKFVRSLPKGYHRIDIVADTYRNISIKSAERKKRCSSSKVAIGSIKSKLPRDINKFLLNDENKTSLIKLIFDYIIHEKLSVTSMLKTEVIILSGDDECYTVTSDLVILNDNLRSNQEEADTKVILHAMQIIQSSSFRVIIRSLSGDTDIMVLALALIVDQDKVYIDYGSGKRRKGTWLKDIILNEDERKTLVGFHSFTGNDYVPALFRKGEKRCWSIMKKSEKFLNVFGELGRDWELTGEVVKTIEEYVCALYGSKKDSVDSTRFDMIMKKQTRENKAIDLSAIPPCFSSLYLQIQRANFVLWKWTESAQIS